MKISNKHKMIFLCCVIFTTESQSLAGWQFRPGDTIKQNHPKPIPPDGIFITFHNQSNKNLQAALRYQSEDGNWVTGGWYKINPNEKRNVSKTNNAIVYVYAESIGPKASRVYWSGADNYYKINGSDESYGFKKYKATGNELIIQFPPK